MSAQARGYSAELLPGRNGRPGSADDDSEAGRENSGQQGPGGLSPHRLGSTGSSAPSPATVPDPTKAPAQAQSHQCMGMASAPAPAQSLEGSVGVARERTQGISRPAASGGCCGTHEEALDNREMHCERTVPSAGPSNGSLDTKAPASSEQGGSRACFRNHGAIPASAIPGRGPKARGGGWLECGARSQGPALARCSIASWRTRTGHSSWRIIEPSRICNPSGRGWWRGQARGLPLVECPWSCGRLGLKGSARRGPRSPRPASLATTTSGCKGLPQLRSTTHRGLRGGVAATKPPPGRGLRRATGELEAGRPAPGRYSEVRFPIESPRTRNERGEGA